MNDNKKNDNKLEKEEIDDSLLAEKNNQENEKNDLNLSEENLEQQIKNFEDEISQLKDEKLRLLAEMENIRKRFEKEKADSIKYGSMKLARDILSPNDNLTRALENIPKDKKISEPITNLIDGLKMVQKEFNSILSKHGITKIDALNKKFDHNLHQAMLEIETDKEEGIVVQELQSGYTMHERLLRPSMVGVSKKAPKNEKN
tara:strand:+ start:1901 stop:2506 length:606 start_codon:yes stop_codon:yes gene_type:complete